MIVHDYIPVNPDDMPYQQAVELGDTTYIFGFQWNEIDRTFSVDLYDAQGNPIWLGEVIHLNQYLWRGINNPDLPMEAILPMDESGTATDIDPGNFGDTVKLIIDDLGHDTQTGMVISDGTES